MRRGRESPGPFFVPARSALSAGQDPHRDHGVAFREIDLWTDDLDRGRKSIFREIGTKFGTHIPAVFLLN
jgi:hypothetical protein